MPEATQQPDPTTGVAPGKSPAQNATAQDATEQDVTEPPMPPEHAELQEPTGARIRREYPAWDRIIHDFFRPGWGQLAMGFVLALVSCGVVVQVHHKPDDTYSTMRRSDLVQLLDQLNAEQTRLNDETNRLERTKQQLANGADAQRVAEEEARKRLDSLGVLAGTVPATGPGVRLTILDPQQRVTASIMLDAVQEMRDAGAEAMQLNGTVRVVASTWFADRDGHLVIDGIQVMPPYVLDVIGEPHALDEGARFRGGLVSQVQSSDVGGQAVVSRMESVQVTALHTASTPQWARPA